MKPATAVLPAFLFTAVAISILLYQAELSGPVNICNPYLCATIKSDATDYGYF